MLPTTFRLKEKQTHRKGMEKVFHANGNKQKRGSSTYIRQNHFKTRTVRRNEEAYFMINGSFQQKAVTLVNIYTLNIEAPKYIKQILPNIKGEINSNTVPLRDFKTPFTSLNRSTRQKINKGTVALSDL